MTFDEIPVVPPELGASGMPTRGAFEAMARRDDVPGALGLREVKFLMTALDTATPALWFLNTTNVVYHYVFAVQALGERRSVGAFNAVTYFRDDRVNLAGTMLAHDTFERPDGIGLYTVEFWPADPVKADHVALAFHAVARAAPFAAGRLAYHPSSETQRERFERERDDLARLEVTPITTEELFGNVAFMPLNPGVGYGRLRVLDPNRPGDGPPSPRDVLVLKALPNDLTHVGGVLSERPQTPLSHVNLRAKQNDTPNAYVRDASRHPEVEPRLGTLVRYEVTADGFSLRPATPEEVDSHLEGLRPVDTQHPARDLSVTTVVALADLAHASTPAVGAKAANVAELRRILPAAVVPDGVALPFSFYDRFMRGSDLSCMVDELLAEPPFQTDASYREERLDDLRERIEDAPVPDELVALIGGAHDRFPAGQALRCRSSTNNEDLEGFNGAGLYDSFTHRPDEGHLANTVKQVWASLWNLRAYDERDFYRVAHREAAMGVLIHPNFDDERANGVAVTKNIYDPNWAGFYVNVQVGENLVTNPGAEDVPDEVLVSAIGENQEYETQYVRRSNQVPPGETVLSAGQIGELVGAMEIIQAHFKKVYDRQDDPAFAMDIEFKVDAGGQLVVKQARPWVE